MKEALFDFKVGYIGTAFWPYVSVIGTLVCTAMVKLCRWKTAFAGQLMNMYSKPRSWVIRLLPLRYDSMLMPLTVLDAFPGPSVFHWSCCFPTHPIAITNLFSLAVITIIGTLLILFFYDIHGNGENGHYVAFVAAPSGDIKHAGNVQKHI